MGCVLVRYFKRWHTNCEIRYTYTHVSGVHLIEPAYYICIMSTMTPPIHLGVWFLALMYCSIVVVVVVVV